MNVDLNMKAFRLMLKIRLAETMIADDFIKNKIFSFLHLSVGQEATAAGVCLALKQEDRVFGNHRSHAHYIAKGGDLYRMFAEIYGKADGCCGGFGGSMHMLDRSVGFMGSTPILGSVAPIATGSAFEQKLNGSKHITVCFFGDGASEEGVVYESINLAAVKKLPIIFVIENNLYAVSTDLSVRRAEKFSASMVYTGLGSAYFRANGNAFDQTYRIAQEAREWVATGKGPAVLEARVFRHMAHSGPIFDDNAGYRVVDPPEVRQQADPITSIVAALRGAGVASDTIERVREDVAQEVASDFARAKAAPEPIPGDLWSQVYA